MACHAAPQGLLQFGAQYRAISRTRGQATSTNATSIPNPWKNLLDEKKTEGLFQPASTRTTENQHRDPTPLLRRTASQSNQTAYISWKYYFVYYFVYYLKGTLKPSLETSGNTAATEKRVRENNQKKILILLTDSVIAPYLDPLARKRKVKTSYRTAHTTDAPCPSKQPSKTAATLPLAHLNDPNGRPFLAVQTDLRLILLQGLHGLRPRPLMLASGVDHRSRWNPPDRLAKGGEEAGVGSDLVLRRCAAQEGPVDLDVASKGLEIQHRVCIQSKMCWAR